MIQTLLGCLLSEVPVSAHFMGYYSIIQHPSLIDLMPPMTFSKNSASDYWIKPVIFSAGCSMENETGDKINLFNSGLRGNMKY